MGDKMSKIRKKRKIATKSKKRKGCFLIFFCIFVCVALCICVTVNRSKSLMNVDKKNNATDNNSLENNSIANKESVDNEDIKKKAEKNEKVDEILQSMTISDKVNQLFIITPEALTGAGCVIAAGDVTKSALENHPVGGIIYFSQNFTNENQTKNMLSNVKKISKDICKVPLFICIDEEGGTVARLGNNKNINTELVENMSNIGKNGDISKAYRAGKTIGSYLHKYGFNLDFAPVADVLTNAENTVVRERSFGSDKTLVSEMALNFSNGLNDEGIYSCFKHFPGHGATKGDTHEGFAYTDKTYEELEKSELVPFKYAIKNNADFIMVGHISVPGITGDNTPASISKTVINDILKTRLGYKGIVITDSLSMGALTNLYTSDYIAVKTIEAGADVLLMPVDFELAYNGIMKAIKSGELTEERIDQSVRKIIEKKLEIKGII